jgi:hypothetical protein
MYVYSLLQCMSVYSILQCMSIVSYNVFLYSLIQCMSVASPLTSGLLATQRLSSPALHPTRPISAFALFLHLGPWSRRLRHHFTAQASTLSGLSLSLGPVSSATASPPTSPMGQALSRQETASQGGDYRVSTQGKPEGNWSHAKLR